MKIVNHECYVSLEVAKLLKEAGFDWATWYFFEKGHRKKGWNYNVKEIDKFTSCPTLDVAQRWLREVKEVDVIVTYEAVVNEKTSIYEKKYAVVIYDGFINEDTDYHDTYEEAQEAGIKKALELILEKGE